MASTIIHAAVLWNGIQRCRWKWRKFDPRVLADLLVDSPIAFNIKDALLSSHRLLLASASITPNPTGRNATHTICGCRAAAHLHTPSTCFLPTVSPCLIPKTIVPPGQPGGRWRHAARKRWRRPRRRAGFVCGFGDLKRQVRHQAPVSDRHLVLFNVDGNNFDRLDSFPLTHNTFEGRLARARNDLQ